MVPPILLQVTLLTLKSVQDILREDEAGNRTLTVSGVERGGAEGLILALIHPRPGERRCAQTGHVSEPRPPLGLTEEGHRPAAWILLLMLISFTQESFMTISWQADGADSSWQKPFLLLAN